MAKTRKPFSAEFKCEAVKLAHRPGIAVAQVAKELEGKRYLNMAFLWELRKEQLRKAA